MPFTWSNGWEGESLINELLDRCITNTGWWNIFPNYIVNHGSVAYSDHTPVCLNILGDPRRSNSGKKPFRFESMWMGHEECGNIILNSWNTRVDDRDMKILEHIRKCGVDLSTWNKICFGFGNVQSKLRNTQARLKSFQESDPYFYFQEQHCKARKEVQN